MNTIINNEDTLQLLLQNTVDFKNRYKSKCFVIVNNIKYKDIQMDTDIELIVDLIDLIQLSLTNIKK